MYTTHVAGVFLTLICGKEVLTDAREHFMTAEIYAGKCFHA